MSKYDFIKDKNIVVVHKTLELEYETEYSGTIEKVSIRVYPYTVEEKLLFKNQNDEGSLLLKSENIEDQKKGLEMTKEATYNAVFAVLKKDDANVTLDHIKKMPELWFDKIIFKALEFEGIIEADIKEKALKKEQDKL